jgi:hypothetical protein
MAGVTQAIASAMGLLRNPNRFLEFALAPSNFLEWPRRSRTLLLAAYSALLKFGPFNREGRLLLTSLVLVTK